MNKQKYTINNKNVYKNQVIPHISGVGGMALFEILSKRGCINILKVLYDEEVVNKAGYTLNLSTIKERLGVNFPLISETDILKNEELISSESVEGDFVLSITDKGKRFIEVFDSLVKLMNNETEEKAEPKKPAIEYDLTDFEKRMLLFIHKITKEKGTAITTKELTEELYPYQEAKSKAGTVAKHISKLADLNLVQKHKDGRKNLIEITDSGRRIVTEQFMKMAF